MTAASPRLLLVDDDEAACTLLAEVLERESYSVVRALSGAEALERVDRDGPFDAVLTDLRMPGSSGLELLREVRARDANAIVFVLTAFGDAAAAGEAIRAGAHDFISKPYDLGQLRVTIGRALARSKLASSTRGAPAPAVAAPRAGEPTLVGHSPAIIEVMKTVARVAPSQASVLIFGEIRDDLDAALIEADRLESMIADLLAHARSTRQAALTHVDLGTAVREHAIGVGRAVRAIRTSHPGPGRPRCHALASPGTIGQVIDVLLDNSLRHGAGTSTIATTHDGALRDDQRRGRGTWRGPGRRGHDLRTRDHERRRYRHRPASRADAGQGDGGSLRLASSRPPASNSGCDAPGPERHSAPNARTTSMRTARRAGIAAASVPSTTAAMATPRIVATGTEKT